MKAVFMNGSRQLTMKIQKQNEDGSVILIDGTYSRKSNRRNENIKN